MGFMAAKKCCNGCEIAQACSHAYTTKPPCVVENFTDAQQLKQAIALVRKHALTFASTQLYNTLDGALVMVEQHACV